MTGTWAQGLNKMTISSVTMTAKSRAYGGQRQARKLPGQYWRFEVETANMTVDEWRALHGFLAAQQGSYGTFTFTPSLLATPRGTATGTPVVNGAHAAGVSSIVTDGWSNSITALKAGDVLKFANHAKVYMITADCASDGSGNATLTIEPALVAAVADDEGITVTSVPFVVALEEDVAGLSAHTGVYDPFSATFVEVWNT